MHLVLLVLLVPAHVSKEEIIGQRTEEERGVEQIGRVQEEREGEVREDVAEVAAGQWLGGFTGRNESDKAMRRAIPIRKVSMTDESDLYRSGD